MTIIFPKDLLNKISFSVSDPKLRSLLIHLARKALKHPDKPTTVTVYEVKANVSGVSKIKEAEGLLEKLKALSFLTMINNELHLNRESLGLESVPESLKGLPEGARIMVDGL